MRNAHTFPFPVPNSSGTHTAFFLLDVQHVFFMLRRHLHLHDVGWKIAPTFAYRADFPTAGILFATLDPLLTFSALSTTSRAHSLTTAHTRATRTLPYSSRHFCCTVLNLSYSGWLWGSTFSGLLIQLFH